MFPDIEVFGILIQWYFFWKYVAIILTVGFGLWYIFYKKKAAISFTQFLLLLLLTIFLCYFGGKLLSYFDHYTRENASFSLEHFFEGSFRWYGALLMILLGIPLMGKFLKMNVYNCLDFLVLKLCLFTAIIKQACFFSGDGCYGIYTNSIFGMYFHYGTAPSMLPVHPTPLYDSVFHLLFFIFLYQWNDRKKYDGQTTIFFFTGTAIFNILLEVIKRNPEIILGLTLCQLTYLMILLVTVFYYFLLKKENKFNLSQAYS